jgi:hypothetical protein
MAEEKKNNELSNAAKIMGAKGGVKGGRRRAEVLSPQERSEIAAMGGRSKAAKSKKLKSKLKKKKPKKDT